MRGSAPRCRLVLWVLLCFLSGSNVQGGYFTETGVHVPENLSRENEAGEGKKETLADKVDDLFKKEFAEEVEEAGQGGGQRFNDAAGDQKAHMDTVVVISHKQKKDANTTGEVLDGNSTGYNNTKSPKVDSMPKLKPADQESDVDRIVDSHDNEYVLSKSMDFSALVVDPVLIRDFTILIMAAGIVGWLFEAMGQPVINGYLVAGSAVGPGGFMLIKELVQIESLAQLGVYFLLFHLGLEFSWKKMRAVGGVALIGGLIEAILFVAIACIASAVTEASISVGFFVGALLSLSSTSVVINCLESKRLLTSRAGQITVGTLILQDCTVGLIFALMPLLSKDDSDETTEEQIDETAVLLLGTIFRLALVIAAAIGLVKFVLPFLTKQVARTSSGELFQVVLVGFCLSGGLSAGYLGVSRELGALIAGAMVSATDQHEYAVKTIDGVRNLFTALFISSIGLVMSPTFMWEHIGVLTVGTAVVVGVKTLVIFIVVRAFRINDGHALMVAMSLSQISEFGFVLLAMAQDSGLIPLEFYLLLIGVAGVSLLITPGVIAAAKTFSSQISRHPKPGFDISDQEPRFQEVRVINIRDGSQAENI